MHCKNKQIRFVDKESKYCNTYYTFVKGVLTKTSRTRNHLAVPAKLQYGEQPLIDKIKQRKCYFTKNVL